MSHTPEPKVLHLYNTLTRSVEPFEPADPERVTFYTCGPTVYDDAHIGNFRAFLFADLLRRFLESPLCRVKRGEGVHEGPRTVRHVMNITDVGHMTDDASADGGGEDKMALAGERLLEAKKAGKLPADASIDPKDPRAIADFYAQRFIEDGRKLGLKVAEEYAAAKKPQERDGLMPRASAHVEGMKRVIEALGEKGYAYVAGEAGRRAVYFDVQKFERYGQLSGNSLDQLRGGAGGRVTDTTQREKHHPADFLLWKEDASHLMKWPGPTVGGVTLGEGYPGWHIECTAMSLQALVPGGLGRVIGGGGAAGTIDLHSGGEDNIFPHHECEIAQSCCLTGANRFARHWVHARYLFFEGGKMSKSKGTFYTARQLFEMGHEPAAVRLELIKTHYRKNADFGLSSLKQAGDRVQSYRDAAREIQFALAMESTIETALADPINGTLSEVSGALAADLNISGAFAALDRALNTRENTDVLGRTKLESGHFAGSGVGDRSKFMQLLDAYATRSFLQDPLPTAPFAANYAARLLDSDRSTVRAWGSLHLIDNILGVIFRPEANGQVRETSIGLFKGVDPDAEVEALLAERAEARKAKDFARADAIRDELAAKGLAIKDAAGGKVEVTRG